MRNLFLTFIFVLIASVASAETLNVLIYCPAINLSTASNEDKELFLEGLVPDSVVATQAWQNATLAQKATWARDNGYLTPYMEKKTLVPLLKSIVDDKYNVLIDYMMVKHQGDKYFFHCLMARNGNLPNVKAWIDSYNEGKADIDKILYWYGDTVDQSYADLWTDESTFAHEIAIRVLRYPAFYHLITNQAVISTQAFRNATLAEQFEYCTVNGTCTEDTPRFGTVKEAQDNGITIYVPTLQKYGVPIRPFGV